MAAAVVVRAVVTAVTAAAPVTTASTTVAGAVGGAAVVGLAGWLLPRAVARLPRPVDLLPGEPGPDYPDLAAARGLRAGAATAGAVLGAALGWRLGPLSALPLLHLAAAGLLLAYVDVRVHRLPDAVVRPSLVLAPLLVAGLSLARGQPGALLRAGVGGAVAWGLFGLSRRLRPDGLGRGDLKLAAWTGLVTAWLSWPALVVGLVGAVALGAVGAVAVLLTGGSRHSPVPFGPCLLGGALLAALAGGPLAGPWVGG